MKRSLKGGKKPRRTTLAERRRIQELNAWANGSLVKNPASVVPQVDVDSDDFSDDDVAIRLATLGDRPKQKKRFRRRRTRRVFFFFKVPNKWRNLSDSQILWRKLKDKKNLATIVSVGFHILLALVLLSIVYSVRVGTLGVTTTGVFAPKADNLDFVDETGNTLTEETSFDVVPDDSDSDSDVASQILVEEQTNVAVADQLADTSGSKLIDDFSPLGASSPDSAGGGSPFFKNVGDATGRAARKHGSEGSQGDVTKESEDAVERGLDWLARHQLPDGGWAFDLTAKDGNDRSISCECSNSTSTSGGTAYLQHLHPSRMAATAIALLPFLGSGYTHTENGPYQKTVAEGLRYLQYHAVRNEEGVDFRDGFIGDGASYVQALAVLTCCEAYEMTKDDNLRSLAEGGMRLIERSQLRDGSWRYNSIGDPMFHDTITGDTSVLGWQMLALHSGVSAGFSLPKAVVYRVGNFLDSVMDDNGRSYRYQPSMKENVSERWGTTAVGVLVREYLGWTPGTDPQKKNDLDRGAEQLTKWIASADNQWQEAKKSGASGRVKNRKVVYIKDGRFVYNLYFAYYSALALRNYGGKYWENSYPKLREFLVQSQTRTAAISLNQCEDGSWLFYDKYMNDGGRLLNTALAVLILETPYRYLPMYRE